MVVLRMKRMGRIRRPFYRIGAMDKRSPRDGRVIEALGWFDPITTDPEKTINLKAGRIHYWLSVGAQPSETVAALAPHFLEKIVRPWVISKVEDELGEAEPTLVAFLCEQVRTAAGPDAVTAELRPVLDDDAEAFAGDMWRFLVVSAMKCRAVMS